jgi:threonine/homoserine/homoserine lactone efflux protein
MFALSALALLVIPGHAVLYILGQSLQQGSKAGLVSVLGISSGTIIHILFAAFGLSAILVSSSLAFSAVKYAGAAYLLFLGVRTIMAPAAGEHNGPSKVSSLGRIYGQGVLVNLLNPKSALFFFAFLPQFVDPASGAVTRQILFLGGVFVGLSICTDSSYELLAGTFGQRLTRNARLWRSQKYISGGVLLTLAFSAAFGGTRNK